MRIRQIAFILGATGVLTGLSVACSNSTGPGKGPDISGTWSLDSFANGGQPVLGAQGTFVFTSDSVTIDLVFPLDSITLDTIMGKGSYTITDKNLNINTPVNVFGQANGTYTFKNGGAAPDTLTGSFISQGSTAYVRLLRP
jgi:hypothetical protein